MSAVQSVIDMILARHPEGVTATEMRNGLSGRGVSRGAGQIETVFGSSRHQAELDRSGPNHHIRSGQFRPGVG